MIRPGLCSVTFREASPAEIVERARRAGLASVEWGGDIHAPPGDPGNARRVGQLTRDAGLAVAAYGSYYRLGGIRPQAPFEEILAVAVELGAPVIRVWAGERDAVEADEETWRGVVGEALRCADLAAAAGLRIAYEWHRGTLASGNGNARLLLQRTGHPAIGTYWQPEDGRDGAYGLAGLRESLPRIANVHVFHWFPTHAEHYPLAVGADRWRAYLRLLASSGRDHDALLEFVKGSSWTQFEDDARTLLGIVGEVGAGDAGRGLKD